MSNMLVGMVIGGLLIFAYGEYVKDIPPDEPQVPVNLDEPDPTRWRQVKDTLMDRNQPPRKDPRPWYMRFENIIST